MRNKLQAEGHPDYDNFKEMWEASKLAVKDQTDEIIRRNKQAQDEQIRRLRELAKLRKLEVDDLIEYGPEID